MAKKINVGKLEDFSEGSVVIEVDNQQVAVFKVSDSEFYAISNICPHQGAPLNEGYLEEYTLTCPWHSWTFDIRSGGCDVVPQDRLRSYKVEVSGDDILLNVP